MLDFVLFLDFDGVLHPKTSGTCRHLPLLESLLRGHPSVQVVISSSWRQQYSLEDLRGWFSEDLQERVIGITPSFAESNGSRQQEIEAWLHAHPAQRWLALDDEAWRFQPGCPWLLQTLNQTGLTPQLLEELATRIRA